MEHCALLRAQASLNVQYRSSTIDGMAWREVHTVCSSDLPDFLVSMDSGGKRKAVDSDDAPELPANLNSLKVPQLKDLCRQRGLVVGGNKQDLILRLSTVGTPGDGATIKAKKLKNLPGCSPESFELTDSASATKTFKIHVAKLHTMVDDDWHDGIFLLFF